LQPAKNVVGLLKESTLPTVSDNEYYDETRTSRDCDRSRTRMTSRCSSARRGHAAGCSPWQLNDYDQSGTPASKGATSSWSSCSLVETRSRYPAGFDKDSTNLVAIFIYESFVRQPLLANANYCNLNSTMELAAIFLKGQEATTTGVR
jgi:hypothetical protein